MAVLFFGLIKSLVKGGCRGWMKVLIFFYFFGSSEWGPMAALRLSLKDI